METLREDQASEISDRLTYATGQLSEFQQLISFVDTKAGAAITLASALLTVLFVSFGSVTDLLNQPGKLWLGAVTFSKTKHNDREPCGETRTSADFALAGRTTRVLSVYFFSTPIALRNILFIFISVGHTFILTNQILRRSKRAYSMP